MSFYVEVVKDERVGDDWLECECCGCKYPPDKACPFLEYHEDPTQAVPEATR